MEVLLVLIAGMTNMACFFLGAKVGQTVSKGEEIQVPEIKGPMELYREHREKKEEEAEMDRMEKIMQNIDTYDGTGIGQQDIPLQEVK